MRLKRENIVGDKHIGLVAKITNIFFHQKEKGIENGIKGVLLYGPPGTGKTTIANTVIYDTINKLGLWDKSDENVYKKLNLADIARSKFGETESIIQSEFTKAIRAANNHGYFILSMDDVDGIFPSRSYNKLEAWYIGHLNVLFSMLDEIKSNEVGIIMTTNRQDLVDDAVLSRLAVFEVAAIDIETAELRVRQRTEELKIEEDVDEIMEEIREYVEDKNSKPLSFREVDKIIIQHYVSKL